MGHTQPEGISIEQSWGGNNISYNIIAGVAGDGLSVEQHAVNNVIKGNTITGCGWGVSIYSLNNTVTENNLVLNHFYQIGVFAADNRFYLNNVVSDSVLVSCGNVPSYWDNGSLGNFWSDYLTKYPNASDLDSSGVGDSDSPYVINAQNVDYYPLLRSSNSSSILPTPSPTLSPMSSPTQQPTLKPSPSTSIPEVPSCIVSTALFSLVASLVLVYALKRASASKKGRLFRSVRQYFAV